ncbi:hypothetical protein ABPG75_012489 [Micractinium tetrahymenae]
MHAACHSAQAPTIGAQQHGRPARSVAPAVRRRRTPAGPVAAVDPMAAAAMAYQAQEFGLTLLGVGMVAGLASSTAAAIRGAAGAYTAAAAAANAGAATATATPSAASPKPTPANVRVEQTLTAAAAASLEGTFQQPTTLGLGDIKAQLRAAADAAVAAVKSAAAADGPAPAPRRAAQADGAPNGAAVRPGMTVEEATKQVREWIEAWQGSGEAEPAPAAPVEVPAGGAPTTRVTEPSMPPTAAVVLSAMTADAPVANTPVDAAPAAAAQGMEQQQEGEQELEPVLAAVAAPAAPASPAEPEAGAADKEAAYKVADSKLSQASAQQQAEQAERRKVVEVAPEHLAKISSLLADSKQKQAREQESLARSEALLRKLAEQEAAERQQLAAVAAAAPAPVVQQQPAGLFAQLLQQLVAVFRAAASFVQQLVARLTGGGSSSAGASA